MCINEGSGATDYTLIGEFKPLLISSFVLRAILWLRRPNVINRYKNGVDESKESKSLVYITHVIRGGQSILARPNCWTTWLSFISSQLPSSRKSCLVKSEGNCFLLPPT